MFPWRHKTKAAEQARRRFIKEQADTILAEALDKLEKWYKIVRNKYSSEDAREIVKKYIEQMDGTSLEHPVPTNTNVMDVIPAGHGELDEEYLVVPPAVEIILTTRIGLTTMHDVCARNDPSKRFLEINDEFGLGFRQVLKNLQKDLVQIGLPQKGISRYENLLYVKGDKLATMLTELYKELEATFTYMDHFLQRKDVERHTFRTNALCPNVSLQTNLISYLDTDNKTIVRCFFYTKTIDVRLSDFIQYHLDKLRGRSWLPIRVGIVSCLSFSEKSPIPPLYWNNCLGVLPFRERRNRASLYQTFSSRGIQYLDNTVNATQTYKTLPDYLSAIEVKDPRDIPSFEFDDTLRFFNYDQFRSAFLSTFHRKLSLLEEIQTQDPVYNFLYDVYHFLHDNENDRRIVLEIRNKDPEPEIPPGGSFGSGGELPQETRDLMFQIFEEDRKAYLKEKKTREAEVLRRDFRALTPFQFTSCIFIILFGCIQNGFVSADLLHSAFVMRTYQKQDPKSTDTYLLSVLEKIYQLMTG